MNTLLHVNQITRNIILAWLYSITREIKAPIYRIISVMKAIS